MQKSRPPISRLSEDHAAVEKNGKTDLGGIFSSFSQKNAKRAYYEPTVFHSADPLWKPMTQFQISEKVCF